MHKVTRPAIVTPAMEDYLKAIYRLADGGRAAPT
jgi:Mn-dependent DtxR family transcriptional regulator